MQHLTIDFMGKRKIAMAFSALTAVIAIVVLVFRGIQLGLDFTGGTLLEVTYARAVEIKEVRDALAQSSFQRATVQPYGGAREMLIRVRPQKGLPSQQVSEQVLKALSQYRPDVTLRRVEFVGPQVGDELAEQGLLAMLVALGLILIYVALRFDVRFAVGAIVALVHDVFLTMGVLVFLGMEFDLTILAALLAIIGYSLNDTIVVYDRIRENFRKMRKGTTIEVMNAALNDTLRRTLMTGIATILVLCALYFLGGNTLLGFTVALLFGVLFGTYSSIYVASALALELGINKRHLLPSVRREGENFSV